MNFRDLGLAAPILRALGEQGYETPTPIQEKAIPPALVGRDVLGCAQTGTGKTCAFAAPILQRLTGRNGNPRKIRALILTPTRELALQIQECFVAYGKYLSLRSAVIFGGVGQQPQVDKLRSGVDILVATPGRLLDLQGQGLLDLSQVEIFVLDEADRMLDMGFIHDVRRVLKLLPQQKQTLFFSATMPPEVMELVNALLHNYARVAVDPVSSPVEVIRQSLYFVDKGNKTRLLAHLIQEKRMDSVLVFSRTKHGANRIAQDLNKRGITAAAIHGNKSQTARVQALTDFKAGRLTALVATDIAARGIDIDELNWVVNYDLPEVAETYVHRIGRTGRAGRDGAAISFCRADERDYLKQIEKLLGKKLPVVESHPFPMTEAPTGVDPMVQARKEGRENARQARMERERAAKAKAEKAATAIVPKPPLLKGGGAGRQPGDGGIPVPKPPLVRSEKVAEKKPAPVQAASQKERPSKRGVRQGDLSAVSPKRPAAPSADFVKPNPLDSDVVMDATARLLAPRTTRLYSAPAPKQGERRQEAPAQSAGNSRHHSHKRGGTGQSMEQPAIGRKAPVPPLLKGGAPEGGGGIPNDREPPRSKKASGSPAPAPKGHRSGRPPHRTFPQERPQRGQRDSTETPGSVMKPYYLSDD